MTHPADGRKAPGWARPTQIGCAVMLLGIVLIIAALIVRAATDVNAWTTWLATLGFALAALGLLSAAVAGLLLTRRARSQFANGPAADLESTEPDLAAVVAIERARLSVVANKPGFPTNVVASKTIPARGIPTYLVTNAPPIRLRGRSSPEGQIEPAAAYQWVRIDARLPRLLVSTDFRGQGAMVGRDIDIENEEFNRRFRIDSSTPGIRRSSNPKHDTFARYASAMLHPRAVDVLLRLPYGRTFIITNGLVAIAGPPVGAVPEIQACADVLADFAALLPPHVLQRWDGSVDYAPAD